MRRLLLATVGAAALSAPALAQEETSAPHPPSATASGEEAAATVNALIVTARRQSERAQDVPIPLSVISGEVLEQKGTYTLEDIQRQVPSFVANNSNPRNSSVGIRGIGISTASDGLDTSVGFYFDNVYLGRPGMALGDLIDIESFEVLRGPQGTLFGRNTSAGVINVTTRRPSFEFGGTVEGSYGAYNYNQLRLSITGPLIDGLVAYRLTAFNTDRGGVLDNNKTGVKANSIGRSGVRGQLLITPNEDLSIRLLGEYSKEDDTCCVSVLARLVPTSLQSAGSRNTLAAFAALGYVPTPNLNATSNNSYQNMRTDQKGFSAEVNYDLGFADLTSVTAWRYWHFDPLQDSDNTPLDIIQVNVATTKDWQWTQELRLASKPGRLNWQAGGYFFDQKLKDHFILNQFGYDASAFYTAQARAANPNAAAISIAPGSQYIGDTVTHSRAWALFGQANFEVTNEFILTGGVRYTKDRRDGITNTSTRGTPYTVTSIPFNYDVEVKGDNVSYLLSASYKPSKDNLFYVSYSTGYKAAGLNLNAAVSEGSSLIIEPEKVKNWELGTKNTFLDGRATLNVNVFHTTLEGLQANITIPGRRSFLANVGDVRTRGVEVDASLKVTDHLDVSVNGSYVDAKYKSYAGGPCPVGRTAPCDLSGERLFQAPKYIANATIRYEADPIGDARPYGLAQISYRSNHLGQVQPDPLTLIPGYTLVNLRIGAKFRDGKYDVSAWVDNLFDKTYFQQLTTTSIVGTSAYGANGRLGAPRTYGVTVRADF